MAGELRRGRRSLLVVREFAIIFALAMIYVHLVESQKHEAARALGAFKKNCHKITTEEAGKIVAVGA